MCVGGGILEIINTAVTAWTDYLNLESAVKFPPTSHLIEIQFLRGSRLRFLKWRETVVWLTERNTKLGKWRSLDREYISVNTSCWHLEEHLCGLRERRILNNLSRYWLLALQSGRVLTHCFGWDSSSGVEIILGGSDWELKIFFC